MFMIPDLFSAYTKGQEDAINQNWQDLSNYEDIQAKRTNNDLKTLDLWYGVDTYGNKVANNNFDTQHNAMNNALEQYTLPTLLNKAYVSRVTSGAEAGAVAANQAGINQMYGTALNANILNNTANNQIGTSVAAGKMANLQPYVDAAGKVAYYVGVTLPEARVAEGNVTAANAAPNAQLRQQTFQGVQQATQAGNRNTVATLNAQLPNIPTLVQSQSKNAISGYDLGTAQNTAMIPNVPHLVNNMVTTSDQNVQGGQQALAAGQQNLTANSETIANNVQAHQMQMRQYFTSNMQNLRDRRRLLETNFAQQMSNPAYTPQQKGALQQQYQRDLQQLNSDMDALILQAQQVGFKL